MPSNFFAGIYWSARRESEEESARRTATFFRLLAQCDAFFTHWYDEADTHEEMLQKELVPDYDTLLRYYRLEENRFDAEEEGFLLAAYTAHEEEAHGAGVNLTCGEGSGYTTNHCFLFLPALEGNPDGPRLLTAPVLKNILRALVVAWDPCWGVIGFNEFREAMRPGKDKRGCPGWFTYVSRTRGKVPRLPAPVQVESIAGAGTLIQLTPERLDVSNPEHVRLGLKVQALLDAENLLRPVNT